MKKPSKIEELTDKKVVKGIANGSYRCAACDHLIYEGDRIETVSGRYKGRPKVYRRHQVCQTDTPSPESSSG